MPKTSAVDILQTAGVATVATTAAAAACGALETGSAAAPVNAISHIAWGDGAARRNLVSVKYTGVGSALNAGAMVSWAAFHHVLFKPREGASPLSSLIRGAATAGVAYVVDYYVVPKRLAPGFEKRLSNWSVFMIYAALAAGLAAGERLSRRDSNAADSP